MQIRLKPSDSTTGTSLAGYIKTTLEDLVTIFGPPQFGPNDHTLDKTTCEWNLELPSGESFTIYDWKEPKTPTKLYDWHIGAHSKQTADLVRQYYQTQLAKILLGETN